jgi:hypothetical protein
MPETSADIKKNTLTNCNGVFIFPMYINVQITFEQYYQKKCADNFSSAH